ncbi:MAG TPA: ABC transporter permease, partial [Vicinamibacteria bacterium]|nr:ABC transporter permease [Vicinamibacteria bacterium]
MGGLWQDVTYAVRRLARRPGFASVAVATLAVGIGAATALFSIVDAVVLRPLPYGDASRLALLWQSDRQRGQPFVELSYPVFRDWREHSRTFEELAGMASTSQSWVLTGGGEPTSVVGRLVTWSFFPVMGRASARGRLLVPEDDRLGAAPVVLLSDRLWRSQFGSDPAIVGRRVLLDRSAFTV